MTGVGPRWQRASKMALGESVHLRPSFSSMAAKAKACEACRRGPALPAPNHAPDSPPPQWHSASHPAPTWRRPAGCHCPPCPGISLPPGTHPTSPAITWGPRLGSGPWMGRSGPWTSPASSTIPLSCSQLEALRLQDPGNWSGFQNGCEQPTAHSLSSTGSWQE